MLSTLGLTVLATVPLVSQDVMAVVYQPEYQVSAPVLSVLCVAIAAVFATYPHVLLLLSSGNQRSLMWISTAGAVLNVAANAWAIPRHGILGAAWTTVATEGFVLLAAAIVGRARTGLRLDIPGLLRPAACAFGAHALLSFLLPHLAEAQPAWRVAAAVGAAAVGILAAGVFPLDLGTEEGAPGV